MFLKSSYFGERTQPSGPLCFGNDDFVHPSSQNCVTSTKRLPLSEYGLRLVSKKFPTGKVARGKAQILCSFFGFHGSFSSTDHSTRHAICDLIFSLGFDLRTCCSLRYNHVSFFPLCLIILRFLFLQKLFQILFSNFLLLTG